MKKIILFGDSITAGYFIEAVSPILPNLIKATLRSLQFEEVTVVNAGMPGDTTLDGLRRLEAEVLAAAPDRVVIFFGANDCSVDRLVSVNQYGANLCTMIQKIGSEKVILITPPYIDSNRQPERPVDQIQQFVSEGKVVAKTYQVPIIDLYQAMRNYPDPEELLQADGLHFSASGYDLLAALIVEEIKGRLVKKEG